MRWFKIWVALTFACPIAFGLWIAFATGSGWWGAFGGGLIHAVMGGITLGPLDTWNVVVLGDTAVTITPRPVAEKAGEQKGE